MDIDGSGINMEVSGMTTGSTMQEPGWPNYDWVKVGINDMIANGIQHTYVIKFSETVDVEFRIENINRDTALFSCYNDRLVIPGATILGSSYVQIVNDTIYAPWDNIEPAGWLHLKYVGIDSLTIIHGEGANCDPGYLLISPLIINGNFLSVQNHEMSNTKKVIRITDIMGNECEDQPNKLLIYIYNDGSTEKVFRHE